MLNRCLVYVYTPVILLATIHNCVVVVKCFNNQWIVYTVLWYSVHRCAPFSDWETVKCMYSTFLVWDISIQFVVTR